jgi:ribosomal protein S18 acetylase RimI-like enzyme
MLFADGELVRRIEQAESRLTIDVAHQIAAREPERVLIAPLAGGVAVHVGEEAPFNKLIGAGLDGPLDAAGLAALSAIEESFQRRGALLQAEVATLADSSLARTLTERGYLLAGFENVLGRRLDDGLPARHAGPAPAIEIRVATDDEADTWMDTLANGFASPDAVPVGESHESFPPDALRRSMQDMTRVKDFTRYLARIGSAVAACAALRTCNGVAQLCGSATLPAFRRLGAQTALLRQRLADARGAGCDVAVVTTQPGSKSQENAQRQGFVLLYSRAVLVRQPAPRG